MPFSSFATLARSSGRLVVVGAAAAAVAGLVPLANAQAAGTSAASVSASQAQARLDALDTQADQAVEAYDQAQSALTTASARVTRAQAAVAAAQAKATVAKAGLQQLAVTEYENGSTDAQLTAVVNGDPQQFLDQANALQQISRYQAANLAKVVDADRVLAAQQASDQQALAAQRAAVAKVAARKAAVTKLVSAQQTLVTSLQHQAALAQQQAAARAAKVSRTTASRSVVRHSLATTSDSDAVAAAVQDPQPVAASGNAAAVLAYAYAQLGKPYRFGGAGPGSFDCSGLAMRAWAAGGVSLPHSAAGQQHDGQRVSLSNLQPGDLVFWGSPAYHVGIYVGGGRILDAPHTGTVVQIQSIWGSPSSAVRP